jgi:hypothetical protein
LYNINSCIICIIFIVSAQQQNDDDDAAPSSKVSKERRGRRRKDGRQNQTAGAGACLTKAASGTPAQSELLRLGIQRIIHFIFNLFYFLTVLLCYLIVPI